MRVKHVPGVYTKRNRHEPEGETTKQREREIEQAREIYRVSERQIEKAEWWRAEVERAPLEMFNWLRSCKQQDMLEACKTSTGAQETSQYSHAPTRQSPTEATATTTTITIEGWTAYNESRALSLNTKTI